MKKATEFLAGLDPRETAISVITRAEILCGMEDAGFSETGMLLDQYIWVYPDFPTGFDAVFAACF